MTLRSASEGLIRTKIMAQFWSLFPQLYLVTFIARHGLVLSASG